MGVFSNRKKSSVLPPLADEMESIPTYEQVLDWLVGLSEQEYKKVCEVAVIYRKANQEAASAQGIANEPYSFMKPEPPEDDIQFLLDDDEPKTKTPKTKDSKVIINKKKR